MRHNVAVRPPTNGIPRRPQHCPCTPPHPHTPVPRMTVPFSGGRSVPQSDSKPQITAATVHDCARPLMRTPLARSSKHSAAHRKIGCAAVSVLARVPVQVVAAQRCKYTPPPRRRSTPPPLCALGTTPRFRLSDLMHTGLCKERQACTANTTSHHYHWAAPPLRPLPGAPSDASLQRTLPHHPMALRRTKEPGPGRVNARAAHDAPSRAHTHTLRE